MKNLFLKLIQKVLRTYAIKVVSRHKPFVVAITGSVGKSSTKEAIYQVLKDEFKDNVWRNQGNLNTEIGLPLTILGYSQVPSKLSWPFFLIAAYFRTKMKTYPKYLVLEMGVDKPGDMEYLTSIVKPDIAIVTSLGLAHLAYFESEEQYRQEKLTILNAIKDGGKAFLNGDDPELAKVKDERIEFIGLKNRLAEYKAEEIKLSLDGMEYRLVTTGKKISIKNKLVGKHLIYAQLFAFAVANSLQVASLKIAESLDKLKPLPGRMNVVPGKDSSTIIDDTYNAASPASVRAALDFLSEIPTDRRKVFILGNMNELGDFGEAIHKEIAQYAKNKCDLAIFAGPQAASMQSTFSNNREALAFNSREDLEGALSSVIKKGDLILVKASQNRNFFEEIVKKLMKNPDQAGELLVRQSKQWLKKK